MIRLSISGDYRGTGGTRPPNILVGGDAKVNVPPLIAHLVKFFLVIRHFSGSLQNAYLGEELKGFCIIKIQFLFSFRGGCSSDPLTRGSAPGPRWGLCPPTPHHSEEIVATAIHLPRTTLRPHKVCPVVF